MKMEMQKNENTLAPSAFQILSTSFPILHSSLHRSQKLLIIISRFLAGDYVCNCAYPTRM